MTVHPVAVRVAEMLMHPEHPMLPQAALDYVREETGLGAAAAYEQVRMAIANKLEVTLPDHDESKSGWYGWWERNELETIHIHATSWLQETADTSPIMVRLRIWLRRVLRSAELCVELESCVIPEPVQ